jgi:imidazolonepropionase-like amidohydrolase
MSVTVVTGARALIGTDLSLLEDPAIVVDEGRIVSVAARRDVHPTSARHVHCDDMTLLPGFIDAHVHIGFAEPRDVLAGGVTTVRDLGWPPKDIFPLVRFSLSPGFVGPRVLAAGQMLTAPGGYPTRAAWAPPGTGCEVSGPGDAREAVRKQTYLGASVIKVALNPPVGPVLDLATLTAIVEAAHERGLKTTGHVHGVKELDKALAAGLDELAHMLMGTERIPSETIDRMVEQGMRVVPTLSVRFGWDRKRAISNLRSFKDAGGMIVYGTDLGNAGPRPGIDPREVKALVAAGLTGTDVVRAATVDSARWLGLDGGCLSTAASADIIAVDGDPTLDPACLSAVRFVMRAGEVVRFPP